MVNYRDNLKRHSESIYQSITNRTHCFCTDQKNVFHTTIKWIVSQWNFPCDIMKNKEIFVSLDIFKRDIPTCAVKVHLRVYSINWHEKCSWIVKIRNHTFSENMWSWTEFNTELVSVPGAWDVASETKPSMKKACVSLAWFQASESQPTAQFCQTIQRSGVSLIHRKRQRMFLAGASWRLNPCVLMRLTPLLFLYE